MNKRWRVLLLSVLATIGLLITTTQTASAAIWHNQDWHAGRVQYNWFGNGSYCTAGPHYYSWANGHYYQAMPAHCFENRALDGSFGTPGATFASVWENSQANKFDGNQIIRTAGSYVYWDLVLVDLGATATGWQPASDNIFNYCNPNAPWNCSSHLGGGTSNNANWAGSWLTITSNSGYSAIGDPVYFSGAGAGTSMGYVSSYSATSNNLGYVTMAYSVTGLNNCGTTQGDSGAPVYYIQNGAMQIRGMLLGRNNTFTAGPGNSCYYNGRTYGTSYGFVPDGDIRNAFTAYNLQAVQWAV